MRVVSNSLRIVTPPCWGRTVSGSTFVFVRTINATYYISCIGERAPKMVHSARIAGTGGLLRHHVYWSISSCGLWHDWTVKKCQLHVVGLPIIEQEVPPITR
jgi:hypothetical protein